MLYLKYPQTPSAKALAVGSSNKWLDELNGQVPFDWRPEGLVCDITLQT